jgi:CheY-like chemotaxis protein
VSLDELSRSQLAHFGDLIGTRVQINGQPLLIEASAAQAIGMALHELATNAGKYGALSNDSGHVTIEWGLERAPGKEDIFFLNWREHGGPPVAASLRRGFGSTVITEMAELSLNAKVDLGFAVAGLTWRLQCRAAEVLGGGTAAPEIEPANAAAPSEHPLAERSRILVVEDEPLVAIEIAHILKKAGFDVIGPARSVAPALSLIEERGCDAAVLDINLGGETSEPVAWRLLTRGAPFVALSGYSRTQHPPVFSGAPALAKPVRPALLVAELRRCLKQGGR